MFQVLMHRGIAGFRLQWILRCEPMSRIIDATPALRDVSTCHGAGEVSERMPARHWPLRASRQSAEDCGPCTRSSSRMAERGGVDPNVLRAVLNETL